MADSRSCIAWQGLLVKVLIAVKCLPPRPQQRTSSIAPIKAVEMGPSCTLTVPQQDEDLLLPFRGSTFGRTMRLSLALSLLVVHLRNVMMAATVVLLYLAATASIQTASAEDGRTTLFPLLHIGD